MLRSFKWKTAVGIAIGMLAGYAAVSALAGPDLTPWPDLPKEVPDEVSLPELPDEAQVPDDIELPDEAQVPEDVPQGPPDETLGVPDGRQACSARKTTRLGR